MFPGLLHACADVRSPHGGKGSRQAGARTNSNWLGEEPQDVSGRSPRLHGEESPGVRSE